MCIYIYIYVHVYTQRNTSHTVGDFSLYVLQVSIQFTMQVVRYPAISAASSGSEGQTGSGLKDPTPAGFLRFGYLF